MLASIFDYIIYLALAPVLLFIVTVAVILLRTRAKLRTENGRSSGEVEGVQLHPIKDATEADEIAYSVVDRYRKRIWRRMSIHTSFGVSPIGDLCGSLISEIAHVYYAESPRPELEVTVTDLLDLNERVIARIRKLLEKFPLSRLQGLRMCQVLNYHQLYTSVGHNVVVRSIRNRWARRAARTAAIAARYADPRFWVMRGMTRGGREFAVRYLLTSIITIAGEEAILLYRRSSAEAEASENA